MINTWRKKTKIEDIIWEVEQVEKVVWPFLKSNMSTLSEYSNMILSYQL